MTSPNDRPQKSMRPLVSAVLAVAVLLAAGLVLYFTIWSRRSPEETLLGQWTLDVEQTQQFNPLMAQLPGGVAYQFQADGTGSVTVATKKKPGKWRKVRSQDDKLFVEWTTLEEGDTPIVEELEITLVDGDHLLVLRANAKDFGEFLLKRSTGEQTAKETSTPILEPTLTVQLPDHISSVNVALSPDGGTLLCASSAGAKGAQIWSVPDKKKLFEFSSRDNLGVLIAPDGKSCVFYTDSSDRASGNIVDVKTGKTTHYFGGYPYFTPDGQLKPFNEALWKYTNGRWHDQGDDYKRGHDFTAISSVFHNGTRIATGYINGQVKVWEVPSGKVGQTFQSETNKMVNALAGTEDGKALAVSTLSGQGVEIWDLASVRRKQNFGERSSRTLLFLSDNRTLAHLKDSESLQGELVGLTRIDTGKELALSRGFKLGIDSLSASADGQTLAAGGSDGSALVWDLSKVR